MHSHRLGRMADDTKKCPFDNSALTPPSGDTEVWRCRIGHAFTPAEYEQLGSAN